MTLSLNPQPLSLPPSASTGAVGPQVSTAATVVVAGAEADMTQWRTLSYTAVVVTNAVTWSVWGANTPDYSDEVAVLAPVSIGAGNNSNYSVSPAPYRYYRVKCIDTVGGTHGSITVNGLARA
jgi:hypothetical protein